MIVVTTPTGNIGRQVLAHLLDAGAPVRVIARHPEALPAEVRARVEIVAGSHSQPEIVDAAFAGAESVFWLVPADPGAASAEAAYVDFARPACAALRRCGVHRVVGISALGRGWPTDTGHVAATLKMDDAIAATGVAYRALACASLMENMLRQKESIRDTGRFFWPTPADFRAPMVATRDVAALAARLLLAPDWTGVESLPLLGPEDISFGEMAAILSQTLGRPVQFQEISMGTLRGLMLDRGASAGMADAMVRMLTAKTAGLDHLVPRPQPCLTPTDFRTWCRSVFLPALAA